MENSVLPITDMFKELVRLQHITPPATMENLRFPGETPTIPTIASYGTPELRADGGKLVNAKLEQRS
jgi:hypothetical protein